MVIQFSVQDLMAVLVGALGIAAGILLLPILWNVRRVVGILRLLVETNQEFANRAIRTMPGIFENMGQISSNVRDTTDKLKISIPVIVQEVECVTSSAGILIEDMGSGISDTIAAYKKDSSSVMAYFRVFEEVLQIIYRAFSARK